MKKINKPEIKNSEFVVGCRVGNTLYINPNLDEKEYLGLRKRVMEHELEHSSGLDKHDMVMDLINNELKGFKLKYWKFVFTHPKTFVGFLPFSRIDGKWNIDAAMVLLWMFAIAIGVTICFWI